MVSAKADAHPDMGKQAAMMIPHLSTCSSWRVLSSFVLQLEAVLRIFVLDAGARSRFIPWPFFIVDGGEECLFGAGTIVEVAITWKFHMMRMHRGVDDERCGSGSCD